MEHLFKDGMYFNKKMDDLLRICRNRKFQKWEDMKEYAEEFDKYDDFTYRNLDWIWEKFTKNLK